MAVSRGLALLSGLLLAGLVAVLARSLVATFLSSEGGSTMPTGYLSRRSPAVGELHDSSAATLLSEQGAWYDGISSISVLSPGADASAQATVDAIWQEMEQDAHGNPAAFQKGQFGLRRRAILLRPGSYPGLSVPVNWYTSVAGVGLSPSDVVVKGFSSVDAYPGSLKGSLENFWKSVEGLTTMEDNTLWAVSQAAPIRRCVVAGDLWLSETDERQGTNGTHYSSGGFLSDVVLGGQLHWGTQQQFFFRSSKFSSVENSASGQSMVFVGVEGAPQPDAARPKPLLSIVEWAPIVAEKPYVVERSGQWFIAVPPCLAKTRGPPTAVLRAMADLISMDDVFVAREGDDSEKIQAGIQGKKALLFTPAIYGLDTPIYISDPGFVVLGIGMPTLVATRGLSALVIGSSAKGARVAQVLLEAGVDVHDGPDETEPLLLWEADSGVASDLLARVGAFSYETPFHKSCAVTKADVMAQVNGKGVVLDNVWLWHADHDDCTQDGAAIASDSCQTKTGLVVNGDDAVVYGLAVEHTLQDLVKWEGENGQLFFFQSELPYYSNLEFGLQGYVGFRIGYDVKRHINYGVGVYQVFNSFHMDAAIRLTRSANVTNMFAWCITGNRSGLGLLACTSPGVDECIPGDCDFNSCQVARWPAGAAPLPAAAPKIRSISA